MFKSVTENKYEQQEICSNLKRFNNELLGSVETLSGIGERYGMSTLVDLLYLQKAINESTEIDFFIGQSGLIAVIQGLPSCKKWLTYVNFE